jgi:hypothetical protein
LRFHIEIIYHLDPSSSGSQHYKYASGGEINCHFASY